MFLIAAPMIELRTTKIWAPFSVLNWFNIFVLLLHFLLPFLNYYCRLLHFPILKIKINRVCWKNRLPINFHYNAIFCHFSLWWKNNQRKSRLRHGGQVVWKTAKICSITLKKQTRHSLLLKTFNSSMSQTVFCF